MVKTEPHDPMIDPQGLVMFLAVAETGSMTLAARRLGLTQSAVSQAMARLESSLGMALLNRACRPLGVTPAGTALLEGGQEYLAAGNRLSDTVRRAAETEAPAMRLGLVDSFAATVGPALIRQLRRHAERISVWSGITPNLMSDLAERRLDMIISTETRALSGMRCRPIVTEPFVLIVPAQLAGGAAKPRLSDLANNHPLVRYSIRSHIGVQAEAILTARGIDAPRSLEFDGSDAVLPMVAAGLGWAITTPLCLVHGRGFAKHLAILPLDGEGQDGAARTLHLIGKPADPLFDLTADHACAISDEMIAGPVKVMAPFAAERMVVHGKAANSNSTK